MDTAFKVLVIIVSSALTIFLLAAIVALVKLIQVVKSIKRITDKAERLADSAEAVGEFFRKSTRPMGLGRLVGNIVDYVKDHQNNKEA